MTQTIKKCNEFPVGKSYRLQDLRTAESIEQLCEYVDAGHPISMDDGTEVRLLRLHGISPHNAVPFYYVDYFDDYNWVSTKIDSADLLDQIQLAPLAYRNGRPLHVGDWIEVFYTLKPPIPGRWYKYKAMVDHARICGVEAAEWRFADEETE
jgi:hypothetical protein